VVQSQVVKIITFGNIVNLLLQCIYMIQDP